MLWILGMAGLICAGALFYSMRRNFRLETEYRTALNALRTDCQRLSQEMALLRQEYAALMGQCGAAVLVLDAEGVIERANPTACRLFGMPVRALVEQPLLQATLSNELSALFSAARSGERAQQDEIRLPGPGGRCLRVSLAPIANDEPKRFRWLLVAQDITELRRLETVRRDFVANVSHELRTPLASIRAMAETLQDGALQDISVADRFLGTIVTEAQRLTRIAEDLLILSNAESRPPERSLFVLSDLIAEVIERVQPQALQTGIALSADIPPGVQVFANRDQIEQVVVNLVDNAIKYTPAGGRVQVTLAHSTNGVAVSVADTGIGILREDLPRIFERFYRVDKARSRQSGGTGLGLSIVKHIVEAHGGQVTVESEYNHGSTFTFTLPSPPDAPMSAALKSA
ncbi:MAG TPA: ATP-binding protein [Chthonomonadaceae bacterium]|nr:ATP-binding protein [Chthonomonadaceae bacterium]